MGSQGPIVVRAYVSIPETLNLSFFTSARDNQPKPLASTWEDLAGSLSEPRAAACTPETCKRSECTEKHGHAWSPASYPKDSPRARSAVYEVSVLVLDIDHVPTDEDLAGILDKIPYERIVHASHSDTPGDRCVRIVVRLTRPVAGHEWPAFWQAAISHLGVPADPATKDASRLYFLPSRPQGATVTEFGDGTDYLYAQTEGPPLDVDLILKGAPTQTQIDVGATPTTTPILPETGNGRTDALDILAQAWPTQGRHTASLALTGALAHAKWPLNDIQDFLADLMSRVYPDGDPSPRKREDQARDSHQKVERGEPVSGWPSLIPHVGEQAVTATIRLLNIGGQKPQWLQNLITKHQGPVKPSFDQVRSHYKAVRSKLLRQRTNPQSQYEAKLLAKVLDHEQLTEGEDDRTHALVQTLRTLIKWAPEQSDHDQLSQLLVHVFPVNVGQDADRAWSDTLRELLDQCAETIAQETVEDGEFEMEVTGVRMGKPKNTLKNLDVALKKLSVRLKFDEFAWKKLISRDNDPWEIFQDRHMKGLWLEIERKWDLGVSIDKWAAYLDDQAYHNVFHPVRDYLDALEWDGVPRLDRWLHVYGQAPDSDYTRAIGRLVLVAAVRRVRSPGCKFDEMLILEGEQGAKKSSALAALCPDGNWFTDELPLGADSKRVIEATGGKFLVEAGELKGMTRKDVGDLKGFLSRQVDEARMAFGREVRSAPRQFVVIGTTNDAQYLRDPTGNRRFWPVLIIEFDVDALLRDRDQLWAEAAHYEAEGESIRLHPRFYGLAAEEQEERRVIDNIEAIVEEAFTGYVGRVKCLDLYALLGKDPVDARPDEQARVGDAMRRIGWARTRRRVNGKLTYLYVKGDEHEQETMLAVTGRKVIRAVGAEGTPSPPKILGKGN